MTPLPSVNPPANPTRLARLGEWATNAGAIATAVGTAVAGGWKGWRKWQRNRTKKRVAEIKETLEPLIKELKTTVEDQVYSLSVESDRRHRENRDSLSEISVRVARVEERTTMMYGIIERRNSPRE